MLSIGLFDVDKKLKDFNQEELDLLLYTKPIPITKKHGAGIYSKHYEGIVSRIKRRITEKAEDEPVESEKNIYKQYLLYSSCTNCKGTRLNSRALSVKLIEKSIGELCQMELTDVAAFLRKVFDKKAVPVIRKAQNLLEHLMDIGVGYLSLDRNISTLSGGESQRVKLARQLDCNLVDLMYIMDEPSIGLHPRDINRLIELMKKLRDKGNSVFIVEHDPEIIKAGEWIIDIGPKAGQHGGEVVYSGELKGIKNTLSITGRYLFRSNTNQYNRKTPVGEISVKNANIHNLKNVTVNIPKGVLTCVTGVAGSGKSSLINHWFIKHYPEAVIIDQSPLGRSSRANPATYTGVFDLVRKEFVMTTGEEASIFSFNSKGACKNCNGQGFISLELHFLDAVTTVCDECNGTRYNDEVLQYRFRNKNIAEVLDMTLEQVLNFFSNLQIEKKLRMLSDVGLGYLKLGQSLSTLSGGEAQRLKLAAELHKEGNIYVMDEPTTGLHISDIDRLIEIIKSLINKDNTVIVIEHNLDIIRMADWIIDMGPEGGKLGGEVIFQGTPENLIHEKRSHTGKYLKLIL